MSASASRRLAFLCCAVSCTSLPLAGQPAAQTLFTDVTERTGLDAFPGRSARNVVFVDYDNDGFQDVFIAENTTSGPKRVGLYRNMGDGRFVDQTFVMPPGLHAVDGRGGAIFGDYDNDGDEDLFLPVYPHNVLLRNDRGVFSRVDPVGDLSDSLKTDGAIWLDYDRDGFLDLYATSYPTDENYVPRASRLLRNIGDGTFADQTAAAGLDILVHPEWGGGSGAMAAGDFNNDGWPDLYVAVHHYSNRLFLNDGQGGFQDVTSGEVGDEGEGFSIAIGDIDNDGDLDLVIGLTEVRSGSEHLLLLNDGEGAFVDQTTMSGIIDRGAYVAVGDYNEDGFVDLLYASFTRDLTALYRNNGNDNHWLRVELVGTTSNRRGIGARLVATSGELVQMRQILGGLGRQQDERTAHFGLGPRTQVDRLEIRWPSGQADVLTDVPADQKIRVFEGREGYHEVRPTTWLASPDSVVAGRAFGGPLGVRPPPFEPKAEITQVVADLSALGGSAEEPLKHLGDGTYGLETTVPEVAGPNRITELGVTIDQSTSLGPHWVRLWKSVVIVPAADLPVFADALHDGWAVRPEWLLNLSRHPAQDYWPAWSPDGQRVAFASDRDDNFEIYVVDADGANPVNLTNHLGYDNVPSWSPDGTRIVFGSSRNGNGEIWVTNADGTDPVNLTNHPAYEGYPDWSPDGARISFYSCRDDNCDIYSMNADGSDPVRLTEHRKDDAYPSWSPDGQRIAFFSTRDANLEIYVIDADGSNPVNLTEHYGSDMAASWSPDGSRIAFRSLRDGHREVYVMAADGTDLVNLTNHPAEDSCPAWSPDGSRIAFSTDREGPEGVDEVYVMELATERVTVSRTSTAGFEDLASLEVQTDDSGEWRVVCLPPSLLDATGYRALRFAFHPGDTVAPQEASLRVNTRQGEVDLLAGVDEDMQIDLGVRDWQVVELPLELLNVEGTIAAIGFSGNLVGTFNLDDIRLVTAAEGRPATAVRDEKTGLPRQFSLEQNYPNPFNPATTIRFTLPGPTDVDLSLYDLLGQRVALLASGTREAGVHVLRWDGRDGGGRELASGVYLYRLQAGPQMETRKLLLLR